MNSLPAESVKGKKGDDVGDQLNDAANQKVDVYVAGKVVQIKRQPFVEEIHTEPGWNEVGLESRI